MLNINISMYSSQEFVLQIKNKPEISISDNCLVDGFEESWKWNELLEIGKSELDQYEYLGKNNPNAIYAKHSRYYTQTRFTVMEKFGAQNVSNGSLKFIEIMFKFKDILFKTNDTINDFVTFHNAELPGGFITAINYFIKTQTNIKKWKWYGNSLISQIHGFSDDYGLYSLNKNNWMMDSKCNGDVSLIETLNYIKDKMNKLCPNGVDLYTSDLGNEGGMDYNAQESFQYLPNLGQVLLAYMLLKKGGNMVIKQFNMRNIGTISLIYTIANYFDKLIFCKPLTSRPGNSEIYIIGVGFKGYDYISSDIGLLQKVLVLGKNESNGGITCCLYDKFNKTFIDFINTESVTIYKSQLDQVNFDLGEIDKIYTKKIKIPDFAEMKKIIRNKKEEEFFKTYDFKILDVSQQILTKQNLWKQKEKNKMKMTSDYSIKIDFEPVVRYMKTPAVFNTVPTIESIIMDEVISNKFNKDVVFVGFPSYYGISDKLKNVIIINIQYLFYQGEEELYQYIDTAVCLTDKDMEIMNTYKEKYDYKYEIQKLEIPEKDMINDKLYDKTFTWYVDFPATDGIKYTHFSCSELDSTIDIIHNARIYDIGIRIFMNDFMRCILSYYKLKTIKITKPINQMITKIFIYMPRIHDIIPIIHYAKKYKAEIITNKYVYPLSKSEHAIVNGGCFIKKIDFSDVIDPSTIIENN